MARDDNGWSDERGARSGGRDRQHREHSPDREDMRSGGARNDRDDYYGNRPTQGDRSPGNNRYEGGGLADGGRPSEGSNRSFANRSWDDGRRSERDDQNRQRGEPGTSGSESGRGFGAPWSSNRERGNSEYDHGPFEDGDTNPRARGQGVYNHRPGQAGQENLGESGNRGESENWGAVSRGTQGGRARGNSYGDSGGDAYGGGGRHGGARGGGAGRSGGGPRSDRERNEGDQRGGRGDYGGDFGAGYGGAGGGQFGGAGGGGFSGSQYADIGRNSGFSGGYYGGGQAGGGAGRSHAGRGPKGWKRSDERVRDDVSDLLERHHEIDASDIEVQVENGEVTLSGTVDDRRTKRLAEDLIEGMSGVREVHNQIRVRREDRGSAGAKGSGA